MAWSISNAMMRNYESSHYSRAQEAASSAVTCSGGKQSAQSNTTPMPDQYYWPDKTTEHSRLSRFGMTCVLLMESLGEDLLMWFRADFPARTFPSQGGGAGLDGARSGLWAEFARIIGEVRPQRVFVENSPALTSRGLGRVLGDLACLGFDAEWGVVSAANVVGLHGRDRIWIVANALRQGLPGRVSHGGRGSAEAVIKARNSIERGSRWPTEPGMGRVANGLAHRVDRIKALGNGQVPRVAATAWEILK